MALFSSPIAHVGLNSGDVVVGKIGDDLRMGLHGAGRYGRTCASHEQLAPADGIAVSGYTQSLVEGFFELRSLGPTRIKGAEPPTAVFVLEGVGQYRTRLDRSRERAESLPIAYAWPRQS